MLEKQVRCVFFQQCNQAYGEAKGTSSPFTVVLVDMNHQSMELQPLKTTISFGVAEGTNGEETLYQLLNKENKAQYSAKQAERNRVHVYRDNEKAKIYNHDTMMYILAFYLPICVEHTC